MKFGRLTVLQRDWEQRNRTYYFCQCDCGNEDDIRVRSDSLLNGDIVSCGCYLKEKNRINLIGNRYGYLVVKERLDDRNSNHYWLCECDCGNEISLFGYRLEEGNISDCGCISLMMDRNFYDLSGDYGIGYTKKNEEFYFDIEDYEKIRLFTWCLSDGYVMSNPDGHMIQMHRIVMQIDETDPVQHKMKIDHINRKRNDDRKENLRLADDFQNVRNASLSRNNTSGVIGVSWDKSTKGWYTKIDYNYKIIYLGTHKNFDDAVYARLCAEREYFKEFAPQQHLFEQYGIPPVDEE